MGTYYIALIYPVQGERYQQQVQQRKGRLFDLFCETTNMDRSISIWSGPWPTNLVSWSAPRNNSILNKTIHIGQWSTKRSWTSSRLAAMPCARGIARVPPRTCTGTLCTWCRFRGYRGCSRHYEQTRPCGGYGTKILQRRKSVTYDKAGRDEAGRDEAYSRRFCALVQIFFCETKMGPITKPNHRPTKHTMFYMLVSRNLMGIYIYWDRVNPMADYHFIVFRVN